MCACCVRYGPPVSPRSHGDLMYHGGWVNTCAQSSAPSESLTETHTHTPPLTHAQTVYTEHTQFKHMPTLSLTHTHTHTYTHTYAHKHTTVTVQVPYNCPALSWRKNTHQCERTPCHSLIPVILALSPGSPCSARQQMLT